MDSCLESALALINQATEGMSDEQLAWHLEGKWSSANVLEHLSMAFSGTAKGMSRMLAAGKPDCRPSTAKDILLLLTVVKAGYFPPGRPAPAMVVPKGISPQEAMRSIRENLVAVDAAIAQCEERFGGRIKLLTHPVLGPLTAREWRRFHFVHTRHHMKQIRRLRMMAGGGANGLAVTSSQA